MHKIMNRALTASAAKHLIAISEREHLERGDASLDLRRRVVVDE